jgi:hypothetical protein
VNLPAALARHRGPLLIGLLAIAAATRVALVAACPAPFGYVFDYYHEGIEIFCRTGRLPIAADCWQCYHPPLYYVLGLPLYALGSMLGRASEDPEVWGLHMLAVLPFVAAAIAALYSARLVRFVVRDRLLSLLGVALILAFPCLFIEFDAPEADIVVTATMCAFLYYMVRVTAEPARYCWRSAVLLGVLAGLAAAAKYSGLIALGTAGVVTVLLLITGGVRRGVSPRVGPRVRIALLGLLVLAVTVAVGGWRYLDNERRYGRPLFANGSAGDAFSTEAEYYWDVYDFRSFDLPGAIASSGPHAPPGLLTQQPIYRSVWTTLYAMGWGDLGFFSVKGRINDPAAPYPSKHIPQVLVGAVLYLGLVPTGLALIGMIATLPRRSCWPLHVMFVLTLASYIPWVLAQDEWALKTKYILFLLPVYVTWAVEGLRWVLRRTPSVGGTIVLWLIVGLVVAAFAWQAAFALLP